MDIESYADDNPQHMSVDDTNKVMISLEQAANTLKRFNP